MKVPDELTLRDVFACFALQGLLSTPSSPIVLVNPTKTVALGAYQLADEMMKARRV